jgi:hypothetical protein
VKTVGVQGFQRCSRHLSVQQHLKVLLPCISIYSFVRVKQAIFQNPMGSWPRIELMHFLMIIWASASSSWVLCMLTCADVCWSFLRDESHAWCLHVYPVHLAPSTSKPQPHPHSPSHSSLSAPFLPPSLPPYRLMYRSFTLYAKDFGSLGSFSWNISVLLIRFYLYSSYPNSL